MILTCPACDTKYVVKDDAIPPGGRQVRCAACKHSWHQDPETLALTEADEASEFGGPPEPEPENFEPAAAEVPPEAEEAGLIAGEPQPDAEPATADWQTSDAVSMEEAPAVADEWRAPALTETPSPPAEEEFIGYAPIDEDEEGRRRRWPLLLLLLVLIAAAAAAFWFFAPPEWKARAGLAEAGATPLQLMITTSDRRPLESGNEMVEISGRVINPTDQEQPVPPIRAELRDRQTQAVVHRWTIAAPARVLAPGTSASFNSAELDVPKGGDELTVTLAADLR